MFSGISSGIIPLSAAFHDLACISASVQASLASAYRIVNMTSSH
jgi:hypothetical protein